ncbi:MAG: efflux RND transporter permease subunit [Nevskia sp.]|nr:efflux RND transporter permease subunit [Nevskia sp.]
MPRQEGGFNLSRWAIEHASFTRFLIVLMVVSGVLAYTKLGQREDPDFTFRVMVVSAYWPGATAKEMELQVTDKLEEKLAETPWLDYTQSYSKPGESQVFVVLREDMPPKYLKDAWYQVRKKVGDMQAGLPRGVVGPFFNDEFGDTYIAMYAFHAEGFSYSELKDYVDQARKTMQRVPGVEKVDLLGDQEPRIYVEFSQSKFAELGISFQQLGDALQGQNTIAPAGQLNTPDRAVYVRVGGQYNSIQEIEETRFRVNGRTLRLGDFARVYRGYEDPPVTRIRHRGKEAMALGVVMQRDADVLEVGRQLHAALAQLRSTFPVGIEAAQITDQPAVVHDAVGEFLRSLTEAVVIVLIVSFFSLGLRTGMVVALTIPLVLCITFVAMKYAGIELQKVSLGALVLALGLLVDDAMISVEMMARKLEEGYTKLDAASFAYTSTAFPMLTGTLITAAGFLPVGLARSSAGEYTFSIFAVVGMALLISWVASVYFTPFIGHWLLRAHPQEVHDLFHTPFYRRLRAAIDWCVEHRWTVIAATGVAFVLGVASFRFIPQQFFPDSTRLELVADLWLPEGSSYAATEDVARRMETKLAQDPDVTDYVAYVGNGSPRFYLPLDQQLRNTNLAEFMVVARDIPSRERLRLHLKQWLAEGFPEVRNKIDRLPNGPPVGWPIQFRVFGQDPAVVRAFAEQAKQVLRANPYAVNVHDNWHEKILTVHDEIDQDKLRVLGVSSEQVRGAAQTILSGTQIGTYREGNRNIAVVARQPLQERDRLGDLKDAYMPTASGQSVPFSQFGRATALFEDGVIWRRNRLPTITIEAEAVDGMLAPDVSGMIERELAPLRAKLPPGYAIEVSGAMEQNKIANDSINAEMPKMAVVILLLLMLQLQHFGRTSLVLLTAPLGIIGAAAALLVTQMPFGFVSLLGVIALAGMIMRNSVILVDQIRQDVMAGADEWTAIVESAVRRFRPIWLTAAAAVLAMVPLSRSVFFGPMAIALMGGLIAATFLTLTFLPALYAAWFRVKRPSAGASS